MIRFKVQKIAGNTCPFHTLRKRTFVKPRRPGNVTGSCLGSSAELYVPLLGSTHVWAEQDTGDSGQCELRGRLWHGRDAPANDKTSSWDGPKTYSLASPSICTHTSPSSALSPQASACVTVPSRLSPCARVRRR